MPPRTLAPPLSAEPLGNGFYLIRSSDRFGLYHETGTHHGQFRHGVTPEKIRRAIAKSAAARMG